MNTNGRSSLRKRLYTMQNAAGALGNGTAIALADGDRVMMKFIGASVPSMTAAIEVSYDGGSNYVNAFAQDLLAAGGISTQVNTVAITTTAAWSLYVAPPGATHLRARISVFATGTGTVTATVLSPS